MRTRASMAIGPCGDVTGFTKEAEMDRRARGVLFTTIGVLMFVLAILAFRGGTASAESAHTLPAPAVDLPAVSEGRSVVVLAGGCFWGVQGVYQHVKGVLSAVSGYTGGQKNTAVYETVGTGLTGHAESVQITYDPKQITFGKLLQLYFSVVHDPTELNRQGPDEGTQYRSTIFAGTQEQANVARAYIVQLNGAHVFKKPIVTTIETGKTFYPAEAYHQDFLTLNPQYPYIVVNDLPKIADLKRLFPDVYRAQPVLVRATTH
jgi:peptide-methionine (S)-S-oxide reductase